jgi:hypothetical protein
MYEILMSVVYHILMIGWAVLVLISLVLLWTWTMMSLRLRWLIRDVGRQYTLLKEKIYEPFMYIKFLLSRAHTSSSKNTSKTKKKAE